jgi:hypothetical protein
VAGVCVLRPVLFYAYDWKLCVLAWREGDGTQEGRGVVEKWIRSAGGGGINVVSLSKFESDETSHDPDRGRGGLVFLYGPDRATCGGRFGGARGLILAHGDSGGIVSGCN